MVVEFERYRMPEYRKVTGILQILASLGLLLGFIYTWLAVISSLGLALQMVVGGVVRVRIKDSLIQTLPAIIFCAINIFIFYRRYFEL